MKPFAVCLNASYCVVEGEVGITDAQSIWESNANMSESTSNRSIPQRFLAPACVFWNVTQQNWSSAGCRAVGLRNPSAADAARAAGAPGPILLVCSCDHLTDFAARLQGFENVGRDIAMTFAGEASTEASMQSSGQGREKLDLG